MRIIIIKYKIKYNKLYIFSLKIIIFIIYYLNVGKRNEGKYSFNREEII